jgi:DNA (cytosine-5)-methyltransferase 1
MMSTRVFDTTVQPNSTTGLFDTRTLAKALRVQPATIKTLRSRGQIPEPSSTIGGASVWTKEVIYNFCGVWPSNGETRLEGIPPANPVLPKVIDLFSGCGGMSLGFQMAGFDILAGFDNWPCAVDTYKANMGHEAHLLDLSDVEAIKDALAPLFEEERTRPGIIGGPPCQDFSSAGKRTEGDRADLTEKYAAVVSHFQPPFFVMENVARAQHAGAFKRAVHVMEEAGYFVRYLVIDASKVGVPQVRKRLITFGTKDEAITEAVYEALVNGQSETSMTIREYFEGELGEKLDVDVYYRHPRSYARRGVFSIDEPSPTIRGVNRPIPAGYPGHPGDVAPVKQARPLTTWERAAIQTFPKEFRWVGSRTNVEQMVGNAVPVGLGRFIGEAIASVL